MKSYLNLLSHILENGEKREDRTNVGTISSFGHQLKFDLRDGFPAVTTKKLAWKGVVSELIWFLEGSDDERRLAEIRYNKNRDELTDIDKYPTIWTDNADNQGKNLGYENSSLVKKLGPIYGVQWRNWDGKDQIKELLSSLKKNPTSRRHILSAWNVAKIDKMTLPPCHLLAQFYVSADQSLDCHMYQRSADMFLGVPFNIASYSLLMHILGQILGLAPRYFIHSFGDAHIYLNSVDQAKEQISRKPKLLPKLVLPNFKSIDELKTLSLDDFVLEDYDPHPAIKAEMAI
tara:strand:+ start:416 stop:1282 length:867 start_codon:yes stop_codon:yes gene_type:complete